MPKKQATLTELQRMFDIIQTQMSQLTNSKVEAKKPAVVEDVKRFSSKSGKSGRKVSAAQKPYFKNVGGGAPKGYIRMQPRIINSGGFRILVEVRPQGYLVSEYQKQSGLSYVARPMLFIKTHDRKELRAAVRSVVGVLKKYKELTTSGEILCQINTDETRMKGLEKLPILPRIRTKNELKRKGDDTELEIDVR